MFVMSVVNEVLLDEVSILSTLHVFGKGLNSKIVRTPGTSTSRRISKELESVIKFLIIYIFKNS